MTTLRNKKAEMSLYGAILIFALIVLMVPFFEFFQISIKTNLVEKNIKSALHDTCSVNGIVIYDDLKYVSEDIPISLKSMDTYIDTIFASLGYTKNSYHSYSKNGVRITNVDLKYNVETRYFKLKYKMEIPFKVGGITISNNAVDKVASSALIIKK